jgi:anti-anti-sigma factor
MDGEQITQRSLTDDVLIVNPGRLLDNNNAPELIETITSAQEREYKFVILDLADLEFLSSAGVGSIIGTVAVFREHGGDIILCNVSATILHVLEVLDLCDYLTIRTDEKKAIEACGISS